MSPICARLSIKNPINRVDVSNDYFNAKNQIQELNSCPTSYRQIDRPMAWYNRSSTPKTGLCNWIAFIQQTFRPMSLCFDKLIRSVTKFREMINLSLLIDWEMKILMNADKVHFFFFLLKWKEHEFSIFIIYIYLYNNRIQLWYNE